MGKIRGMAINLLLPLLVDIVQDMLKPEGVTKFREKIIELFRGLAGKTEPEWDDYLVEKYLVAALSPDNFSSYGVDIIRWAKAYVIDTITKYDDKICLPILIKLENILELE